MRCEGNNLGSILLSGAGRWAEQGNNSNFHQHESVAVEQAKEKIQEQEEEAFKNIVGSRGRFMTYMGIDKIRRSFSSQGKDLVVNRRSSVVRASLIISRQITLDKFNEEKDKNILSPI